MSDLSQRCACLWPVFKLLFGFPGLSLDLTCNLASHCFTGLSTRPVAAGLIGPCSPIHQVLWGAVQVLHGPCWGHLLAPFHQGASALTQTMSFLFPSSQRYFQLLKITGKRRPEEEAVFLLTVSSNSIKMVTAAFLLTGSSLEFKAAINRKQKHCSLITKHHFLHCFSLFLQFLRNPSLCILTKRTACLLPIEILPDVHTKLDTEQNSFHL